MSHPSNDPLISEDVEQKIKQKLIEYYNTSHRDRVEDQVNALLAFESHRGRLVYLQNIVGPELFAVDQSILVSGYSVGSEMIVAKQMGFGEVHGVEVRHFYYEVCKERVGHIPGMHPQIYDGSHLPYGKEKFSVVVSSHVIEHTSSPELYLKESMRVLMPGGYLLLEFPHRYHHTELHTGLRSFEWLPHRLRNMVLKALTSRFSPLDARKKKGYWSILDTNLQQMSVKRVTGALKMQEIPFKLVDQREWRPGVIRCIVQKEVDEKTDRAERITHDHRKLILTNSINIKDCKGLEIGPLDKPLVSKTDGSIKYLDYLSKEELNTRHAVAVNRNNVVDLDYVNSPENTLSETIKEKFDYVIACHVIEHIPNMIAWLNEVGRILKEDGCLFLAIPDKRYTFDILRPTTSLSHFLNDYQQNVQTADFEHIFEHIYMKRDISSVDVWNDKAAGKLNIQRFSAQEAYNNTISQIENKKYPEVHCHVFISQDFLGIVNTLIEMKLIPYTVYKFEDVSKPYNEFILILKKGSSQTG